MAAPLDSRDALIAEYRTWLDRGRTPSRVVGFVTDHSTGWTHIDHMTAEPRELPPGTRVLFTDRDRTALLVIIGREPLIRAGARLIAAHIDTPAPRLDLSELARDPKRAPLTAQAHRYGGLRLHHWVHVPLALVGRVAVSGDREVEVSIGLEPDDFALYATRIDTGKRTLEITLGSIAADKGATDPERDATTLFSELERRHGVDRADLATAELYLVPRARAREVGLDRQLIGAHGQDDRSNSYLAWRAIVDLPATPERTAMVWLVDREEEGSHHVAGATSQFLEAAIAYLLRSQESPASEAALARVFDACTAISADAPAALNPNFPEVHELQHAPIAGRGAVMFTYTGSEGKSGGSQAHAALIRSVLDSFERAGQPIQQGLLGRVDEGGGGTVAKYLANRGIDVIDVGVAGISLHSPMELFAKDDLFAAYLGFRAWLAEH